MNYAYVIINKLISLSLTVLKLSKIHHFNLYPHQMSEAKRSLEMLGKPSAEELMMVIAATGLAQNFAAVRSLVTTGIQQGHMKMHLMNILNHLEATEKEISEAITFFKDKIVSFNAVRDFIALIRNQNKPKAGLEI